jgi:hypothetical protein
MSSKRNAPPPAPRTPPSRLYHWTLFLAIFLSILYNFHIYYNNIDYSDHHGHDMPINNNHNRASLLTTTTTTTTNSNSMAACLMIRDDNALLSEWLAYHYMVLPLRMLVVGIDMNSTQDPRDVLTRWKNDTALSVVVWNHTEFIHRFGDIPVPITDENHHYIHRQRAFITTCAEYMYRNNQRWVAFVDTDEYIILNRMTQKEKTKLLLKIHEETTNATTTTTAAASLRHVVKLQQRIQATSNNKHHHTTVLEAIQIANRIEPLPSCHVMPRLLYSALENETCDNMQSIKQLLLRRQPPQQQLSYKQFSTLRYVQHAQPGAFYPSKWGKVLVDVSRLNASSFQIKPKNAHRPFHTCPKPLVYWEESFITVNHYLGSYQQYSSRNDSRRSKQAFEERAYFSYGEPLCENKAHEWLERLIDEFGMERAKYLLMGE